MKAFSLIRGVFTSRQNPEEWTEVVHILWRTILMLAGIIAFCGVIVGVWTLLHALGLRGAPASVVQESVESVSREQLTQTLDLFDQRELRYEALQAQVPIILDPAR